MQWRERKNLLRKPLHKYQPLRLQFKFILLPDMASKGRYKGEISVLTEKFKTYLQLQIPSCPNIKYKSGQFSSSNGWNRG